MQPLDLAFSSGRMEERYLHHLAISFSSYDRAWCLLQAVSMPLWLIRMWDGLSWDVTCIMSAVTLMFLLRYALAKRVALHMRYRWLRPALLLLTDTLRLAVTGSINAPLESSSNSSLPRPNYSRWQLVVYLTAGNPALHLAILAGLSCMPFRHNLLLHTGNTVLLLSILPHQCQQGGGFEAGSYRLLRLLRLRDDSATSAARCTQLQVVMVLALGFVLPAAWYYLSELGSRLTFLRAAGCQVEADTVSPSRRLLDVLLVLVPLAVLLSFSVPSHTTPASSTTPPPPS